MLKIIVSVVVALAISLLLTIICIAFTPSLFNSTLATLFELLPRHQFLEHYIVTKEELLNSYKISTPANTDKENFQQLRIALPEYRDKSNPIAQMLVVHDYPQKCQYTLVGMHKTLDVAWQVTGLRCGNKKSCQLALEQQVCKEKKEPNHERHR